ncbi:MAG: TIGR01212 family radical SAM protein [Clostridia bacterium]|nr:TIGR01212 family radical SAM protein [Clostridia bacterium]
MKKLQNPYPYSDTNKRYYTFEYFTRKTYGKKCAKLPLDIGCSCPNIDGTKGRGGCIYCSPRGAGDFAASSALSVTKQLDTAAEMIKNKWADTGYIPYFQAHTNTYGDAAYLKQKYKEAASYPGAAAVSIATRADALTGPILEILSALAEKTDVFVELGLQTCSDETAALINRCMTTEEFIKGYEALSKTGVKRCIHIINGLPGEDEKQMLDTARFTADLLPDMVKIHMLYIVPDTKAAQMYYNGELRLLDRDEYVSITAKQLTYLPPQTVIGRLTGDAPLSELIAPDWTRKKVSVLNEIDKYMANNDLWQGKEFR